jgi:hypothetical protein
MGPQVSRPALAGAASLLLVAGCTITTTGSPAYPTSALEWNVDRPGSDYRSFDMATPSPEICQQTCLSEPACVAFTYVNPGVQAPNARCWLKNAIPNPVPQTCCVSGTKAGSTVTTVTTAPAPIVPTSRPAAGTTWEPTTDRMGSDYRSFDLPSPQPELCQDACLREPQCLAFTYVNPGVQGANARCWLKNAVPNPQPNGCCLSGVKAGGAPPPPPPPAAPPPPTAGGTWEPQTDRPGSDYRSFDLPSPRAQSCREACFNEPQCRAFTYVNPGVQGANARCWLKHSVPNPTPNSCCLSGVR